MKIRQLTQEHALLLTLSKRMRLSPEQQKQLDRCQKGHDGETAFDQLVVKHGSASWYIFKNIWLDIQGAVQIDALIVTEHGPYVLEIKNFGNHFRFDQDNWYFQNNLLTKNINHQLQASLAKCQSLGKTIPAMLDAQGLIVFVNERAMPEIKSAMPVNYLLRHQIFDWLDELKQPNFGKKIDVAKTVAQIKKFVIPNPYDHLHTCPADTFAQLRTGIHCSHCDSFEIEIGRYGVSCACGHHENKERAVLRTICEYGVLRSECDLRGSDVIKFLDYQVNRQYVRRKLKAYFKPATNTNYSVNYINPAKLYHNSYIDLPDGRIARINN